MITKIEVVIDNPILARTACTGPCILGCVTRCRICPVTESIKYATTVESSGDAAPDKPPDLGFTVATNIIFLLRYLKRTSQLPSTLACVCTTSSGLLEAKVAINSVSSGKTTDHNFSVSNR